MQRDLVKVKVVYNNCKNTAYIHVIPERVEGFFEDIPDGESPADPPSILYVDNLYMLAEPLDKVFHDLGFREKPTPISVDLNPGFEKGKES
jgi:hypothetical protein